MLSPEVVWVVRTRVWEGMPEHCWEKGRVAIGWERLGDLRQWANCQALAQRCRSVYKLDSAPKASIWARQMYAFANQVLRGDWVVTPDSNGRLMVGVATGGYRYSKRPFGANAPHVVPVRWITRVDKSQVGPDVTASLACHLTVFQLPNPGSLVLAVLGQAPSSPEKFAAKVQKLIKKVVRAGWKRTEAATIGKLVIPVLQQLGWHGIYEIEQEYQVKNGAVDLALLRDGEPLAFIEAKALNAPFKAGSKEVLQAIRYAAQGGAEWAVLTDGVRWWVFDPLIKASSEGRLVLAVDMLRKSPDADPPEGILLLTRYAVLGGALHAHARRVCWFRAVNAALASPSRQLLEVFTKQAGLARDEETLKQVLESLAEACPRPPLQMHD